MSVGQKVIEQTKQSILSQARTNLMGQTLEQRPIKLALVSCGLGHINRGVEVSTARWYDALKGNRALETRLFAGAAYPEATWIKNLPRDWLLTKIFSLLAKFSKRRIWEFCYGVEQISFAICFIPSLIKWRPDIVWTKEAPFAHLLLFIRQIFGLKYKIIFANGCGFKPSTYACFDHIQHLHSHSFSEALQAGLSNKNMSVLANFTPKPSISRTKAQCREYFAYSPDAWVIACVAAWNRHHKRIDYLIEEVAKIKDKKVELLLCGHPELDTDYLKLLAQKLLPGRVQWHTLPPKMVPIALRAADVLVLPSLTELFGGVLIEAIMNCTPVIAHHTAASTQLSQMQFQTYDLSCPGNLANSLIELHRLPPTDDALVQLANRVGSFFSEETLCRQFVEMAKTVATNAEK